MSRREYLELEKSHAIASSRWKLVVSLYDAIDNLPPVPSSHFEVPAGARGIINRRRVAKVRGKAAVKAAKRQRRMGRQHPTILR